MLPFLLRYLSLLLPSHGDDLDLKVINCLHVWGIFMPGKAAKLHSKEFVEFLFDTFDIFIRHTLELLVVHAQSESNPLRYLGTFSRAPHDFLQSLDEIDIICRKFYISITTASIITMPFLLPVEGPEWIFHLHLKNTLSVLYP